MRGWIQDYEPAAVAAAAADFEIRFPDFDPDGSFARLRRTEYGRLDDTGQIYLDYTGGGLHGACQVEQHAGAVCAPVCSATRTRQSDLARITALVEHTRDVVCEFFGAAPEIPLRVHCQRQRGLAARRRVVPVRARRPSRPDRRQPQLGQRHPRVRPRDGAGSTTSRSARPSCASTGARSSGYCTTRSGGGRKLLAFPAQSNFSGVQHPSTRRRGAAARLGRPARRRRVRADEPHSTSRAVATRFRRALASTRCSDIPTGVGCLLARRDQARAAAPAVVRRRHGHHCVGAAATATTCTTTRPGSRTARSTTSTSLRWRSACSTCERSGCAAIHAASQC